MYRTIIIQPLNKIVHHGRRKSLVHASLCLDLGGFIKKFVGMLIQEKVVLLLGFWICYRTVTILDEVYPLCGANTILLTWWVLVLG
jgi:hypothetical protein